LYLTNHHLVSSKNLDELREIIGKQIFAHELSSTKKNHEIDASIYGCTFNNLSISYLSYGDGAAMKAHIRDDQCADQISINIATAGTGSIEQNGQCSDLSLNKGLIFDIQQPCVVKSQDCSALTLSFSIQTLRKHARSLIGERADSIDLRFDRTIDFASSAGQALRNSIVHVAQEMEGPLINLNNAIAMTNLENYLLTQLITLQPNASMDVPQHGVDSVILSRHIKRARDYIHAHAHKKITLQDLVAYVGCSYRTLQSAFNKTYSMSPMAYLHVIRLEHVHEALLEANGGTSNVSDIARKWGFMHMGRLAKSYSERYGVLPSDTLYQKK